MTQVSMQAFSILNTSQETSLPGFLFFVAYSVFIVTISSDPQPPFPISTLSFASARHWLTTIIPTTQRQR
jgi:hypothetical protein